MKKGRVQKHNIDIMFLMVLFLIFTFSAVSVLLMAVNSYRSVVYANESNANLRTATSYIREQVRQHDSDGAIDIGKIDGIDCIKISEAGGYSIYIYEYNGSLMELEAKDGAGATADFGNKILEIASMDISKSGDLLKVDITEKSGQINNLDIAIRSVEVESNEE